MGTANTKRGSNRWTLRNIVLVMGIPLMVVGMTGIAVGGAVREINLAVPSIFVAIGGVFITMFVDPTPSGDDAATQGKKSERSKPSLKRDDLEWTRSGDDIRGSYRDFVIYLTTIPRTRHSNFYVTVKVLRRGNTVSATTEDSHDAAIEKGLSVIRHHLDAERATDQVFGLLVGKPTTTRGPHSQISSSVRSREAFRRYMA